MKTNQKILGGGVYKGKGFTLIELLVVVLIIGILVAIAIPQYRRAVLKSQSAQAYTMVKSMADAQRRHLLETGQYAVKFSDLDVDVPGTVTTSSSTGETKTYGDWQFSMGSEDYSLAPGTCFGLAAVHVPSNLYIRFDFYQGKEHFFCANGNAGASTLVRAVCASLGKPVTCPVFCGNSWMVTNTKCWQLD